MSLMPVVRLAAGDSLAGRFHRTVDDVVRVSVEETIRDVRERGDEAVLDHARRFDCPSLSQIAVSEGELESASIAAHLVNAIRFSSARVRKFHQHQIRWLLPDHDPLWGWSWRVAASLDAEAGDSFEGQRYLPLKVVGAYVPGGKAAYPSSVLMNAIPAQVAGVDRIVLTTPCRSDGLLHPGVLVAARELGISELFKIGGAAAIAAMTFGTESIPRVDKIVGPGNLFVNEAKRQLWGSVGLDSFAGPSEVAVLVDGTANPRWAAADLLTQIEHSDDNRAFLVAWSEDVLQAVLSAVETELVHAPRAESMRRALANHSQAILAVDKEQAIDVLNAIAPEHASVMTADAEADAVRIDHCGCVLIGDWTPQSAGDFVSGPSHTLPTSGGARFGSPVNILDFIKVQSISRLTQADLAELVPAIEAFGEMEGFPSHARGATIRLE
ncbi:MAG: Histidinol dehydrogenase [Fimbriimonadaceae bacterium]|nr:Histidinol dehydrogenase [Fimbriimonadaceae bacterium]